MVLENDNWMENWSDNYEWDEECEKHIMEFFEGRKVRDPYKQMDTFIAKHDRRYHLEKTRFKDLTIYREDKINESARCDDQFVNNLHIYYGNGSVIQKGDQREHYAIDNVKRADFELVNSLKSLGITHCITQSWLSNACSIARPSTKLRRCFSACNIYPTDPNRIIDDPPARGSQTWYMANNSLKNVDKDYVIPIQESDLFYGTFCKFFTKQCLHISKFLGAKKRKTGLLEISRILFSTVDGTVYAIDRDHDERRALISFSRSFYQKYQNSWMGNGEWVRKNVVLYLEEYVDDETQFRRAIHIGTFSNRDVFLEMDTGNIRSIKNANDANVRLLPPCFKNDPPAIFEMRFKHCNGFNVHDKIADVRKSGRVCIVGFDSFDRSNFKMFDDRPGKTKEPLKPNNILTLVVVPAPLPPAPSLSRQFCDERDCMGLCGMRRLVEPALVKKIEPIPLSLAWDMEVKAYEAEQRKKPLQPLPPPAQVSRRHMTANRKKQPEPPVYEFLVPIGENYNRITEMFK